jgi:hypothetical protein
MDNNKVYAPLGLALAGLAALAAFGFYVVQQEFSTGVQISLALVLVGIVLFFVLDPERARAMIRGRQARYGGNAAVLLIAFLGILVVINYVVFQNAQDWNLRKDLTEDQEHTLAPETLEVLASVPNPVHAEAFFTVGNFNQDRARELLEDYEFFSDGTFSYEFVDPNEDPLRATAAGITSDGTIILTMGGASESITVAAETQLTAGIIKLMNPTESKFYFVTGHGERDTEEFGDIGISQAKTDLIDKNYIVESINLLTVTEVPADATALVIAGPIFPFTPEEVGVVQNYVESGGSLMVMFEPVIFTEFGEEVEPLTAYLETTYDIAIGNDLIVDLTSGQPVVAIGNPPNYAPHAVTNALGGVATVFPTARSIDPSAGGIGVAVISTALEAWAEEDMDSLADSTANAGTGELVGPVPIVVAFDEPIFGGRIAIMGDADYMSNVLYSQFGNSLLFVGMADWIAENDALISLTQRDTTPRILLPPQGYVTGLLLLVFVFVIPGMCIAAGIIVFAVRRRRS